LDEGREEVRGEGRRKVKREGENDVVEEKIRWKEGGKGKR
jgi:hypothetical protein